MDAPSPQSVGREFVRQYYTLLNKAPDHLHRFYNNNSSFVHGGLDPHNREATLVVGQKQIYNKIQTLRFRDCHAKISQVDAQSTLGNGVVVQVTGELSNDGEPMRRFTQTFVLASQSPKKYYVHNDIFRYQDLISDDENELESRSENDDEQEQDIGTGVAVENNNQLSTQDRPPPYYTLVTAATVQSYQQPAQLNGVVQHEEILQNKPPTTYNSTNNVTVTNNVNNNNTPTQAQSQPITTPQQTTPIDQSANVTGSPNTTNIPTNDLDTTPAVSDIDVKQNDVSIQQTSEIELIEDNTANQNEQISTNQEKVPPTKPTQNEPKTYAQFFKEQSDSSGLNFVSPPISSYNARTSTNNSNSYASRTSSQQDGRSDTTPNTLGSTRSGSSRTGQVRGWFFSLHFTYFKIISL